MEMPSFEEAKILWARRDYVDFPNSYFPENDLYMIKNLCGGDYKALEPDSDLTSEEIEEKLHKIYKERLIACARESFIEMTYAKNPLVPLLVMVARMRMAGVSWASVVPNKQGLSNRQARAVIKDIFIERRRKPVEADFAASKRDIETDAIFAEQIRLLRKLYKKPFLMSEFAPEEIKSADAFEQHVYSVRRNYPKENIFRNYADYPPLCPEHVTPRPPSALIL